MIHPYPQQQKNQSDFLEKCPPYDKEYHAALFRIGNASFIYHQMATNVSTKNQELYYQEWLEGLPPIIKEDMKTKGFEKCKTMLPFTRYVNERDDIGMDEWMQSNLSESDYKFYKSNSS
jgi:hypothetical protein